MLVAPKVVARFRAAAVLLAHTHSEKRPVIFPGGRLADPFLGKGRSQRRNQHSPPDAPGKGGSPAHRRLGQRLGEFLGVFDKIATGFE